LTATTYEGGMSTGGDWEGFDVWHWFKGRFEHPWAVQAHRNAVDGFAQFGGAFHMWHYKPWRVYETDSALGRPLVQAILELNDEWHSEASAGYVAPVSLSCADDHYSDGEANYNYHGPTNYNGTDHGTILGVGEWKSWHVRIPESGIWNFAVDATSGASLEIAVDDRVLVASGASDSGLSGDVELVQGRYGIKVRCISGSCDINAVDIAASGLITLLDESFDGDLADWTTGSNRGKADWQINGGALVTSSDDGRAYAYYTGIDTSGWSDYTYTVDVRSDDNDEIGVLFAVTDEDNCYRFIMDRDNDSSSPDSDAIGHRRLERVVGGSVTKSWSVTDKGYAKDTWHTVAIEVDGLDSIRISIDDVEVFDITDGTHVNGSVGAYANWNGGLRVDDIAVTGLPGGGG
jgi:hypothetical protein